MKNNNPILLILLMIACTSFTEKYDSSSKKMGIYLSESDFINHRISYTDADKISLNKFFAGDNVTIVLKGKTVKLAKKSVYGYHSSDNGDYRFYKNEAYQIVAAEKIFIYTNYHSVSVIGGKGNVKKEFYFFSVKGDDPLIPLTIANLRNAYPSNAKLQDLLDTVKSEDELTSYLTYQQQLKVVYLLNKSQE